MTAARPTLMDIRDVVAQLAAQARSLIPELLPAGHREGAEWVCPGAASPLGCSVSAHLTGTRAGVWCAWASGEAGDILGLDCGRAVRRQQVGRATLGATMARR